MKCRLIMSIGHSLLGHIGYKITGHNGGNVRVLPALLHHSACSCRPTWPDARRRLARRDWAGSRRRSPVPVDV